MSSIPAEGHDGIDEDVDEAEDEATPTPSTVQCQQQSLRSLKERFTKDYINLALLFVPIGFVAGAVGLDSRIQFTLNLLALIPLAGLLALFTKAVTRPAGMRISRALGMMLCNGVEMIICIIALSTGHLDAARSSLLGSILSYTLLVLGSMFLRSGYDKVQLCFKHLATNIMETALMVASISLIVPTTFSSSLLQSSKLDEHIETDILLLSRGTCVFLLLLFCAYQYFQLTQHIFLSMPEPTQDTSAVILQDRYTIRTTLITSMLLLATVVLATANAFYLVRALDPLSQSLSVSKTFISIVILPLAGNLAAWIDFLRRSRTEDLTYPLQSVIGRTLQLALFALPMVVVLGWMLGIPIALDFDIFQASVLFLAIIVMNSVMQEGTATYFEGAMLMGSYIIISLSFFVQSNPDIPKLKAWMYGGL